ncbi:hypothetical protein L596_005515 [Steinernema carpocapsae]|uniref:Uncharacterized protein n=1 Tax=Steinernema carpocapsae TaxID=34508 RepID=A0A4U8UZC8_STECR|nr:hypothetical protein L596_005515 [Steinernema carpocapsae]
MTLRGSNWSEQPQSSSALLPRPQTLQVGVVEWLRCERQVSGNVSGNVSARIVCVTRVIASFEQEISNTSRHH